MVILGYVDILGCVDLLVLDGLMDIMEVILESAPTPISALLHIY